MIPKIHFNTCIFIVRIGDGGRSGTLTVYNPMSDSWDPVCADGWNVQVHSKQICSQLLYK